MTIARRQALRYAALIIGGWTMVGLLFVPQTYLAYRQSPAPLSWWKAMAVALTNVYVWAPLTPLAMWLVNRYPIERRKLAVRLLLHAALSLLFAVTHVTILGFVNSVLLFRNHAPPASPISVAAVVFGIAATNIMMYWSIIALTLAITYFRRYQERELTLMQARLQSLRAQLHPHFLFNTLNAIAELIHRDAHRAEQTLTQLSDLLRASLQGGGEHAVTLQEEIAFLRTYIAIHQTLLEERLAVQWDVHDDALDALVPAMILQPLVENAIRHGIAPRERGGTIMIRAQRAADLLHLEVADDGPGLPGEAPGGQTPGIGLANTQARLRHMYGDAHAFLVTGAAGGGVAVRIALPFRELQA